MQDDSLLVQQFLADRKWPQIELARKAGVSQATVSRALVKTSSRNGGARRKLMAFIKSNSKKVPKDTVADAVILKAFHQIWDKTDNHAEAVAVVIRSLSGLKPSLLKQGRRT